MILSDLIAAFRFRIDDEVVPFHVSDERAAKFISEAEREAAVRARLIYGRSDIAVAAEQGKVSLSEKVFSVDSVQYSRAGGKACPVNLTGLDTIREYGLDRRRSPGTPHFAVHEPVRKRLALFPVPNLPGTVAVFYYRLPLYDLEEPDDEPEIPEPHHEGLVEWAAYRTYSSKDSELYDEARAQDALVKFTDIYGSRPEANVMRRHAERRRVTTRYGGIR